MSPSAEQSRILGKVLMRFKVVSPTSGVGGICGEAPTSLSCFRYRDSVQSFVCLVCRMLQWYFGKGHGMTVDLSVWCGKLLFPFLPGFGRSMIMSALHEENGDGDILDTLWG